MSKTLAGVTISFAELRRPDRFTFPPWNLVSYISTDGAEEVEFRRLNFWNFPFSCFVSCMSNDGAELVEFLRLNFLNFPLSSLEGVEGEEDPEFLLLNF